MDHVWVVTVTRGAFKLEQLFESLDAAIVLVGTAITNGDLVCIERRKVYS